MIKFGPAGNSDSFYEQGYKSSVQMPEWLKGLGLNAYEYQCGKGVNISESTARQIGEQAKLNGIALSVHAPYYINMASVETEKRQNSKRYVFRTMEAAKWMGAGRIVVHTGSCSDLSREVALGTAMKVMAETISEVDAMGYPDIIICPEVLGKLNQLGSLEEIMEICRLDERLIPTVDFGHIHARGMGALNTADDFDHVLDIIENTLGTFRLKNLHCHFSRIEFSRGGEKKHWTLDDKQFGPDFELLAGAIVKRGMEPVIICESRDNMAEDALKMKKIYEKHLRRMKSE